MPRKTNGTRLLGGRNILNCFAGSTDGLYRSIIMATDALDPMRLVGEPSARA